MDQINSQKASINNDKKTITETVFSGFSLDYEKNVSDFEGVLIAAYLSLIMYRTSVKLKIYDVNFES